MPPVDYNKLRAIALPSGETVMGPMDWTDDQIAQAAGYTPPPAAPDAGSDQPSRLGVTARGAERGILPTLAGIGTGAATGAALSSWSGPGAIIGGIIGGIGGGYAASKAQDAVLKANPGFAASIGQSPEQQAADMSAHPYYAAIGEAAPGFVAFRPSLGAFGRIGAEASTAQRAAVIGSRVNAGIGAGTGAAMETYNQLQNPDGFDVGQVALQTGLGALQQKETRFGRKITGTVDRILPGKMRSPTHNGYGEDTAQYDVPDVSVEGGSPLPTSEPTNLLALPDYSGRDYRRGSVQPQTDNSVLHSDQLGNTDYSMRRAGQARASDFAQAPEGSQANLFDRIPDAPVDTTAPHSLLDAQPSDPAGTNTSDRQGNMFYLGQKDILGSIREQTGREPDGFTVKLSKKLSDVMGSDASGGFEAQRIIDQHRADLETAKIKPSTIEARHATLDAVQKLVDERNQAGQSLRVDDALGRPPQPGADVTTMGAVPRPPEPNPFSQNELHAGAQDPRALQLSTPHFGEDPTGPLPADPHTEAVRTGDIRQHALVDIIHHADPKSIVPEFLKFVTAGKGQYGETALRPEEQLLLQQAREHRIKKRDFKTAVDEHQARVEAEQQRREDGARRRQEMEQKFQLDKAEREAKLIADRQSAAKGGDPAINPVNPEPVPSLDELMARSQAGKVQPDTVLTRGEGPQPEVVPPATEAAARTEPAPEAKPAEEPAPQEATPPEDAPVTYESVMKEAEASLAADGESGLLKPKQVQQLSILAEQGKVPPEELRAMMHKAMDANAADAYEAASSKGTSRAHRPTGETASAEDIVRAAEVTGSSDHLLDRIGKANTLQGRAARMLKLISPNIKVEVHSPEEVKAYWDKQAPDATDNHEITAYYDHGRDVIVLNRAKAGPHSFLHEMAHALTLHETIRDGKLGDAFRELYKKYETLEVARLRAKGHEFTDLADAHSKGLTDYGMVDVDEFIAEVWGSDKFRNKLMGLADRAHAASEAAKGPRTLLQQFTDLVRTALRKALGRKVKTGAEGALGDIMKVIDLTHEASQSRVDEMGNARSTRSLPMKAYHGSPHDHNGFDSKHIGSGEGAQVYGHGLYFTGKQGIAEHYRNILSPSQFSVKLFGHLPGLRKDVKIREIAAMVERAAGKNEASKPQGLPDMDGNRISYRPEASKVQSAARTLLEMMQDRHMDLDRAAVEVHHVNSEASYIPFDAKHIDAAVKIMKDLGVNHTPKGKLYTVDIPDDHYLHWDKQLHEQTPEVQDAVRSALEKSKLPDAQQTSGPDALGHLGLNNGLPSKEALAAAVANVEKARAEADTLRAKSNNLEGHGTPEQVDAASRAVFEANGREDDAREALIEISPVGQDIYRALKNGMSNDPTVRYSDRAKAASAALKDAGLEGIKYLNGTSRNGPNAGEEDHNYVVFNDNKIKILAKAHKEDPELAIRKLPEGVQPAARTIYHTLASAGRTVVSHVASTADIVEMIRRIVPSSVKYDRVMMEKVQIKEMLESATNDLVQKFRSLPAHLQNMGKGTVNSVVQDMGYAGEWGFQPHWLTKTVQINPEMKAKFDALPKNAQEVVKGLFEQNHKMLLFKKEQLASSVNEIYDHLIADATDPDAKAALVRDKAAALSQSARVLSLQEDVPYASRRRYGDYVLVGRSPELEAAIERGASPKEIEELKKDETHYYVNRFETMAEAEAARAGIVKAGIYDLEHITARPADQVADHLVGGKEMMAAFQRLREYIQTQAPSMNASQPVLNAVNKLAADLQLSAMASTSARKSEMRTLKIGGGELDMMRNFVTQSRADAHLIAAMAKNDEVLTHISSMRKEASAARGEDGKVAMHGYNEMMLRHLAAMDYRPNALFDTIKSVTSFFMLQTSPSYYLQNATQPLLLSAPYMAGKHGMTNTWAHMTKGYSEIGKIWGDTPTGPLDITKIRDADSRQAIKELSDLGAIDIGADKEMGEFRSLSAGPIDSKIRQGTTFLRNITRKSESINRVVTGLAAYQLERKMGMSHEVAVEYAARVNRVTHGTYDGYNAPRFMRGAIGSTVTQFRKFQLMQASLLIRMAHGALHATDPVERGIARRSLLWTLGHTAVTTGLMGLPAASAITWAVNKYLSTEDEPADIEQKIHDAIGDNAEANLLLKGVPSLWNWDISGRIGMGQTFSLLPYTDPGLARNDYAKTILALTGPGIGGVGAQVADGLDLMRKPGQFYRGVETLLPAGLHNGMRAYREATQGVTKRNGEMLVKPDEIGFGETFARSIGISTIVNSDRARKSNDQYDSTMALRDHSREINEKFAIAHAANDAAGMEEARQEFRAEQLARRKEGLRPQQMGSLMAFVRDRKRKERATVEGVQYAPRSRSLREAQAAALADPEE